MLPQSLSGKENGAKYLMFNFLLFCLRNKPYQQKHKHREALLHSLCMLRVAMSVYIIFKNSTCNENHGSSNVSIH